LSGNNYVCRNCEKDFYRSKSEIARGRTKFCSTNCSGIAFRDEKSPNWKGGRFINESGYVRVKRGRKYPYEHRLVMEESLGRKLSLNEDVHHIDGNKLNNSLNNLEILSKSEHTKLHGSKGEENNFAKLTNEEVLEVRRLANQGKSNTGIAKLFSIHHSNVRLIVKRKTWKHLLTP